MKTIQALSTFLFLLITIPTLLILSSRKIEPIEPEKIKVVDSIEYRFQEQSSSEKVAHFPEVNAVTFNYPVLKGCTTTSNVKSRKLCTQSTILKLLQEHFDFNQFHLKNSINRVIRLSFIINSAGDISDYNIDGFDKIIFKKALETACEFIQEQLQFIAGKINGKVVTMELVIPLALKIS